MQTQLLNIKYVLPFGVGSIEFVSGKISTGMLQGLNMHVCNPSVELYKFLKVFDNVEVLIKIKAMKLLLALASLTGVSAFLTLKKGRDTPRSCK